MKALSNSLVAVGLAAAATAAAAASPSSPVYAPVVSSTPVTAQVTVPTQRCVDVPGTVQAPPSGAGAVLGGVIGGLAGNAIGAGAGRALATGVGAIAGIVAGNNIEAASAPQVPVTTTRCAYGRSTESRIVGYDVVYEFNGQRHTTRTPQDPGSQIALDVRPAGSVPPDASPYDAPPSAPYPSAPYPAATYVAPYPGPVVYGDPVYPGDVGYPFGPIVVQGRFGGWGHRH